MAPHNTPRREAEKRLGGDLDRRLHLWRQEGISYNAIARRIQAEAGVVVTAEAVRLWWIGAQGRLGIDGHKAAS